MICFSSKGYEFTSSLLEPSNLPVTWMSRSTWPSQAAGAEPSPEPTQQGGNCPASPSVHATGGVIREAWKEQSQGQATRLPLPASSLPSCTDYCPVFQRYSRWPRTIISSRRHINSTQVVLKSPSWSFNLYTVSSIHFIAAISVPLTYGSLTCVPLGPSSDVKVNF